MKYCEFKLKDGFHQCGSAMFNLDRDGIDQGTLCDVHYWQTMHKACAESKQEEIKQAYLNGVDDCAAIARNYIGA